MRLLRSVRRIRLPQWRLVAGCLYQTVWNVLTGRARGTGIRDYDLIYFDEDLSWAAEAAAIRRVAAAARGCVGPVEARNQARVHLWFESRFGSPYLRLSSDIPERRAKSSRNAERHQIGLVGDIIPDSRATSPGISRLQFSEDFTRDLRQLVMNEV